jgi:hypothetical protein
VRAAASLHRENEGEDNELNVEVPQVQNSGQESQHDNSKGCFSDWRSGVFGAVGVGVQSHVVDAHEKDEEKVPDKTRFVRGWLVRRRDRGDE